MAGTMRKMGIYLGLVENDDTRAYGRFDARQSDEYDDRHYGPGYDPVPDRRYGDPHGDSRADTYADSYAGGYSEGYGEGYADAASAPDVAGPVAAPPEPERTGVRRGASGRPLGLAPASGGHTTTVTRGGGGSAAAAQLHAALARDDVEATTEPAAQPYRITALNPQTYNDARQIGESFRDGMPVIMNLTEMADADAKRLVDFAAGLSFGLRGSIERVAAKVFLLSPRDVDVTAEDKEKAREGGLSVPS